jgi:hypothetical protein
MIAPMDGKTIAPQNETHNMDEIDSLAVERTRRLCETVRTAAVGEDGAWFRNLLFGILRCALLDHYSVTVGAQKSVYLAAWGCRNLLELRVVTAYVLASESNAITFKSDLIVDAKEFYEALTKHHVGLHNRLLTMLSEMSRDTDGPMKDMLKLALEKEKQRGPETDATDAEVAMYKALMAEFGISSNATPMWSRKIAELVSQSEDFNHMFKACSKIMHRTVFSIASTAWGGLDPVIPLLNHSAVCDLISIYGLIDEHIKK